MKRRPPLITTLEHPSLITSVETRHVLGLSKLRVRLSSTAASKRPRLRSRDAGGVPASSSSPSGTCSGSSKDRLVAGGSCSSTRRRRVLRADCPSASSRSGPSEQHVAGVGSRSRAGAVCRYRTADRGRHVAPGPGAAAGGCPTSTVSPCSTMVIRMDRSGVGSGCGAPLSSYVSRSHSPYKNSWLRRVAPRPDIGFDDDAQLDRSRRAAASPCAGHIEQALDESASLGRARPSFENDEDVDVAGRPQAAKHGRAVQVRAEHIAAEHVYLPAAGCSAPAQSPAGPVSDHSRHDSRLDTPYSAEWFADSSAANTRKLWETASMGFDSDCACSCWRAGLALFQSRSSNAHGAVRT